MSKALSMMDLWEENNQLSWGIKTLHDLLGTEKM